MLPLLVLRPEPGATRTLRAAQANRLAAAAFPLFAIEPLAWDPVPSTEVDALLLGSANAIRHGGNAISAYRGLPAYCVGLATADSAADAGLTVVAVGKGGLQSLMTRIAPHHRRLLRLAGQERVELSPPDDVQIIVRETYASEPLMPPPDALVAALREPCVVMLHSGEAAAQLLRICEDAGISKAHVHIAAIGPRVAQRAGLGWAMVRTAPTPDDPALLALAAQMCQ